MYFWTLSLISFLPTLISPHGIVTHPPVRTPGPASIEACGPEITALIKADNQSSIEVLHKASATDPLFQNSKCIVALCKGLQLADNLDNVQKYSPGEVVAFTVWTKIPHQGWLSVAIVDSSTDYPNKLVGEPLVSFETDSLSGYEVEEMEGGRMVAPVDIEFNVTIPGDLEGRCGVAGDCVLQWTWFGRVVKQTYESCVDFIAVGPKSNSGVQVGGEHDQKVFY